MITELTFTYAGYDYRMVREGNQYIVYYWQEGKLRTKNRICANYWLNGNQKPVKDEGTLKEFERRVRELQSLTTPKGPRPPFVADGAQYSGPLVRRKGQVTPREKRQNGRAE